LQILLARLSEITSLSGDLFLNLSSPVSAPLLPRGFVPTPPAIDPIALNLRRPNSFSDKGTPWAPSPEKGLYEFPRHAPKWQGPGIPNATNSSPEYGPAFPHTPNPSQSLPPIDAQCSLFARYSEQGLASPALFGSRRPFCFPELGQFCPLPFPPQQHFFFAFTPASGLWAAVPVAVPGLSAPPVFAPAVWCSQVTVSSFFVCRFSQARFFLLFLTKDSTPDRSWSLVLKYHLFFSASNLGSRTRLGQSTLVSFSPDAVAGLAFTGTLLLDNEGKVDALFESVRPTVSPPKSSNQRLPCGGRQFGRVGFDRPSDGLSEEVTPPLPWLFFSFRRSCPGELSLGFTVFRLPKFGKIPLVLSSLFPAPCRVKLFFPEPAGPAFFFFFDRSEELPDRFPVAAFVPVWFSCSACTFFLPPRILMVQNIAGPVVGPFFKAA